MKQHRLKTVFISTIIWFISHSVQAQPMASRIKQMADSLQRITQPEYYQALLVTHRTVGYPLAARTASGVKVNNCYNHLCGLINGEIQSIKTGEWNDPTTWSVNRVPMNTDVVRVRHTVSVPISFSAQARLLRYDAGGRLQPMSGSRLRLGE